MNDEGGDEAAASMYILPPSACQAVSDGAASLNNTTGVVFHLMWALGEAEL